MTKTIVIAGLLLATVSCDKNDETRAPDAPDQDAVKLRVEAAKAAADDTGKNVRDRDPASLTATDQSESEGDRNITQQIRQGVMSKDGLSMNAKNVKIITRDGVVTLKGPVDGADERAQIAALAQSAAGVKRVDNQLEVAAP